jgi:ClpX C4-type zinc finger
LPGLCGPIAAPLLRFRSSSTPTHAIELREIVVMCEFERQDRLDTASCQDCLDAYLQLVTLSSNVAMSQTVYCSFCRKPDSAVSRLIAGPAVFICDSCVVLCARILAQCPAGGGKPAARIDPNQGASTATLLDLLKGQEATLQEVRDRLKNTIEELRHRDVSWEKIGKALGCSRQAAWERFG